VQVGDLVKLRQDYFSVGEESWVGVVIDFNIRVDNFGDPQERLAVIRWNDKFHEEEEYIEGLEVINEKR
jgi:hypothetical protein